MLFSKSSSGVRLVSLSAKFVAAESLDYALSFTLSINLVISESEGGLTKAFLSPFLRYIKHSIAYTLNCLSLKFIKRKEVSVKGNFEVT